MKEDEAPILIVKNKLLSLERELINLKRSYKTAFDALNIGFNTMETKLLEKIEELQKEAKQNE